MACIKIILTLAQFTRQVVRITLYQILQLRPYNRKGQEIQYPHIQGWI